MVLLCGIPTETPVALLRKKLQQRNINHLLLNQREFAAIEFDYEIAQQQIQGHLTIKGEKIPLAEIKGVYNRMIHFMQLPEYKAAKQEELKQYCQQLHLKINEWMELSDAVVVNKNSSMTSNMSKPYQINLIRKYGLDVPETLISNNPEAVFDFYKKHKKIIYKSASGERSIVKVLTKDDFDSLQKICWCPTQFQAYVEGKNIRVHVLGDKVFPTLIDSDASDYRYDSETSYHPFTIPDYIKDACVRLTRDLGMCFSGVDLKYDDRQGRFYCFEVNPSPAYSHYELHAEQDISSELATFLKG